MTFLNPFFLFGLAAASLPVLFHFFARKRARRVEFSSIRFLTQLEKSSMRSVKVRQWLLLLIRTLLVIAIVLAFARPAIEGYLGNVFGASHANSTVVFLVDNSASMTRSDEHGVLLKQAKDAALEVSNLMQMGDEAAVIPLAALEHGKEITPLHTRQDAIDAIGKIQSVDRPAQLNDALLLAAATLSKSNNINKEVYLFSDAQKINLQDALSVADSVRRSTKDTTAQHPLRIFDAKTRIYSIRLGGGADLSGVNLSLDSLKPQTTVFEAGRSITFDAWVRNTTTTPAKNVVISLFYNDERVAQRTVVSVAPGATERTSLEAAPRGTGSIEVRAELEPDQMPFDNTRYQVVTIPQTRHIAIFAGNPSDAIFTRLALEQTVSATSPVQPFQIEMKRPEELKSLGTIGATYDAVLVMLDDNGYTSSDMDALRKYVTSGRGAAIFFMPGLTLDKANKELLSQAGLTKIESKIGAPNDNTHYLSFAQFDFSAPFFAGMFQDVSTTGNTLRGIESPRIYENFQWHDGTPLIKLSNGASLLSEVSEGKGSLLVYTIPPNTSFSDWPRKSIFLPLIRRSAAYLSSIKARNDENLSPHFVTTDPFDVDLPLVQNEQPGSLVLVRAPNGYSFRAPVFLTPEGRMRIHIEDAPVAGNYKIYRDAEARDIIGSFPVNIESDEAKLESASDNEMQAYLLARSKGTKRAVIILPHAAGLTASIVNSRYGVELWQSFLWLAVFLAFLEMIVAREGRILSSTKQTGFQ